jgi:hypothetical protein
MVLNTKSRNIFAAKSFESLVVEINVGYFHILVFERVGIYAEAVILAGYFYLTSLNLFAPKAKPRS